MAEKKDMRDKKVCTKKKEKLKKRKKKKKKKEKEKKRIWEKEENFQPVLDVGAMFIGLLNKYEYVPK